MTPAGFGSRTMLGVLGKFIVTTVTVFPFVVTSTVADGADRRESAEYGDYQGGETKFLVLSCQSPAQRNREDAPSNRGVLVFVHRFPQTGSIVAYCAGSYDGDSEQLSRSMAALWARRGAECAADLANAAALHTQCPGQASCRTPKEDHGERRLRVVSRDGMEAGGAERRNAGQHGSGVRMRSGGTSGSGDGAGAHTEAI